MHAVADVLRSVRLRYRSPLLPVRRFWVDFLATVQWDIIIKSFADSGGRVLSLSRLLKILRLARASRLIMRLTGSSTVNTGYIDSIKLFLCVALPLVLSCVVHLSPRLASLHCSAVRLN